MMLQLNDEYLWIIMLMLSMLLLLVVIVVIVVGVVKSLKLYVVVD